MKKLWIMLSTVFMAVVLVSCILSDDVPDREQSGTGVYSEKDVFGLNETAVFKTLKFTATEVGETKESGLFTADSGKVFVGVKFTVENISDEEETVSSILLFDAYADGIKCEYSISANSAFDGGGLDGTLAPDKKMIGWYAVEVPENWKELELTVKASWLSKGSAKFKVTSEMVSKKDTDNQEEESVKTVFGLDETAYFENLRFTANEIKEINGEGLFEANRGKKFVGVKFTVENISDEAETVSSILLFDAYADGIKCEYSISANSAFDGGGLDGTLAPDKKMIGWYAVEVPENWKELDLVIKAVWLSENSVTFRFT